MVQLKKAAWGLQLALVMVVGGLCGGCEDKEATARILEAETHRQAALEALEHENFGRALAGATLSRSVESYCAISGGVRSTAL